MQELTQEAWERIATILGEEAKDYEACVEGAERVFEDDDDLENWEYTMMQIKSLRERAEAFRSAVGAVLWVAENAADRCRFMILDAHPPDDDQEMLDNREDRKGEEHHEGL